MTAPDNRNNPFPVEAVATYGSTAPFQTSDSLRYMLAIAQHLDEYIFGYLQRPEGFALGLVGPYGSGKTHVLMWAATVFERYRTTIRSRVVYAKCDSAQFIDIYKQVIASITRDELIELVQLALLRLAREQVLSARLTESVVERLETPGALTQLHAEQNIDLEQLKQELVGRLEKGSMASRDMALVILQLPDPTAGPGAYIWLSTNGQADLAALGIQRSLGPSSTDTPADADLQAITILDLLAGLYREAGVPFVLMLDQLEVLLRDEADVARVGSTFKKLIEQLRAKSSAVLIAGTPEGWKRMPPDVFPRLRTRDPIRVGRLDVDEIEALLKAYGGDDTPLLPFADELQNLSNGSPREVLRMAYHAWDRWNSTGQLTEQDLVASADKAGSIADQAASALATADAVLAPLGTLTRDVKVGDFTVDRLLRADSGEIRLALVVIRASDALQEIDWYRDLGRLDDALASNAPGAERIAVTVGYSSEEASNLISRGRQIRYDESTWETELRDAATLATVQRPAADPVPAIKPEELQQLIARLDELEHLRRDEYAAAGARFESASSALSSDIIAQREIKTRAEIEEALDAMRRALDDGDTEAERSTLRTILIANERHVGNNLIASIGRVYRELLPTSARSDPRSRRSAREHLLIQMNRELHGTRSQLSRFFEKPWALATMVGLVLLTIGSGIVSTASYREHSSVLGLPRPFNFVTFLPYLAFFGAYLLAACWMTFIFRRRNQKRSLERQFEALIRPTKRARIRDAYPQA